MEINLPMGEEGGLMSMQKLLDTRMKILAPSSSIYL